MADGNVHAPGIEFAAGAGITAGCGDGSIYCPNDPVTRGQVGTFLHRLSGYASGVAPSVNADQVDGADASDFLGAGDKAADAELLDGLDSTAFLGVGDKAADAELLDGLNSTAFLGAGDTAVDADKVDGRHANELIRVAYDEAPGPLPVPGLLSTTIEAPTVGFLIVSASANLHDSAPGSHLVECTLWLDGALLGSSPRMHDVGSGAPDIEESCASDSVTPVLPGVHTVELLVDLGSGTTMFGPATLWALFVPFDAAGA